MISPSRCAPRLTPHGGPVFNGQGSFEDRAAPRTAVDGPGSGERSVRPGPSEAAPTTPRVGWLQAAPRASFRAPAVPRIYSLEGRVFVESPTVAGRWLEPRGVVYYGYFDDAGEARRALALGTTPTFPDVRATLPLDERAMALLLALRVDEAGSRRGFVPRGIEVRLEREHVLKWGNRHCGDDKARAVGPTAIQNAAVVEPFVEGSSERILLVGDHAWHLRYESTDWRRNVGATVTRIEPDEEFVDRARRTTRRLGLAVAGVDYVVGTKGATH